MREMRVEWVSRGESETVAFGRRLGRALVAPVWVGLRGDLGAGKTRLAQGLCQGMGYAGRVRSPTFVLENRYQANLPIRHQDLYRLEVPDEEMAAEWQDDRESVFLVEWADRASVADLPESRVLIIDLSIAGEHRRLLRLFWTEPVVGDWDWEGGR